jgi:hypothetical protein
MTRKSVAALVVWGWVLLSLPAAAQFLWLFESAAPGTAPTASILATASTPATTAAPARKDTPLPIVPPEIRFVPGNQVFPAFIIARAIMAEVTAAETVSGTDFEKTSEKSSGVASGTDSASDPSGGGECGQNPTEEIELGDPEGLVQVLLKSPKDACPVTIEVSCPEIMETSRFEGILPKRGVTCRVMPKILWSYGKLKTVRQTVPVTLVVKVTVAETALAAQVKTLRLRTVNDCLYSYEDHRGTWPVWWMYCAYVNENHPLLDPLLKEALGTGIVEQFAGYQNGDPADVYRQVYAIWHVLQKRGIRYASIEGESPDTESSASQHVRFVDDTIGATQANCVDGAVLLASLLRRIGLKSFLVMVPGHCYLGLYLDNDKATRRFIETTSLNAPDDGETYGDLELERLIGEEFANNESWAGFVKGISEGRRQYAEHVADFENETEEFGFVDLEAARHQGVLPIAVSGDGLAFPKSLPAADLKVASAASDVPSAAPSVGWKKKKK